MNFIIFIFLFSAFILPSSVRAQQLTLKDRKSTTLEYIQKAKQSLGMSEETGLEDASYDKKKAKSSPETKVTEKEIKESNQK